MIRGFLGVFIFLISTSVFANDSYVIEQQLSDALDEVITCGVEPVNYGFNPLGFLLGTMWKDSQARAPYYDNYLDPLQEAILQAPEISYRELPEYQALVAMQNSDEAFLSCPQKVPNFVYALEAMIQVWVGEAQQQNLYD